MPVFQIGEVDLHIPETCLNPGIAEKLASGAYEADEARAARMRLRKGLKVLELGAGLGFVGSVCAGIVGAENLTSVEANPEMIDVVRGNLDRNGYRAASLIHGAVCGNDEIRDRLEFSPTRSFCGGHVSRDNDKGPVVAVPVLRIGDLLSDHRPDVVIMDVEGAEADLFDAPWPGHVRHVMMELHPRQYPDTVIQRIVDCLSASGMTYDPGPSRGKILCFRRIRAAR
ncbi:MAG: FkbM family methyltransferase [Marinibacterium sp.]